MKSRFTKLLSILLSVVMLFTVCAVASQAQDATDIGYYVKAGGTGDGRTAATPAKSVASAIASMNEDGYGAGDSVNIYLMQDGAISTATIDADNYHNLPSWRDASAGEAVPAHTAEIVIQPYNTSIRTYLAESTKYGDIHPTLTPNGPTVLKYVSPVTVRGSHNLPFIVAGDKELTWIYDDGYSASYQLDSSGGLTNAWTPTISTGNGTVEGDTNINVKGHALFGELYVGSWSSSTKSVTHKGNVNITFDHPSIGSHSSKSYNVQVGVAQPVTIEKNLNVIVKDVTDVKFNTTGHPVTVLGAVNYVVAPGENVLSHLYDVENFVEGTKIYTFKPVTKNVMGLIQFTDTPGVFNIADGKEGIATDEDGNQFISENGVLTVPAGIYTFDEYVPPVTKEYFIKYGGTGDGLTRETPVATVQEAITLANAEGLAARDTVLITVLESDTWNATVVDDLNQMTAINGIPSIVPQVVIQGDPESESKVHLAYNNHISAEGYRNINFYRDVTMRNLILVSTCRDSWIYLYGVNDLILEDTVDFTDAYQWGGGDLPLKGQPLINSSEYICSGTYGPQAINLSAPLVNGATVAIHSNCFPGGKYADNYDIVIDNADAGKVNAISLSFGGSHGNVVGMTFEKLININVKNASKVNFVNAGNDYLTAKAVQLILNTNVSYNTTDIASQEYISATTPVYTLLNTSGDGDAIAFTSVEGKYKIKEGYVAVATNTETRKKYTSENKVLIVPEAGTYEVAFEKEPDAIDYYVKNGGTGDGRTPENPAGTVADVIASVNEDGLIKGDYANINIMQRSDWNAIPEGSIGKIDGVLTTQPHNMTAWSADGNIPAHAATIVLKKYESGTTYLAFTGNLGDNVNLNINGPTIFEGVTLVCMRKQEREIIIGNNDVTFGANVAYGYINNDCYSGASQWDGTVKTTGGLAASIAPTNYSAVNAFNKEFTTTVKGTVGKIRIGTSGYGGTNYNEDYNIVVDSQTANLPLIWGGSDNRNGNTFKKNININVISAPSIVHSAGNTNVTVNGGIQAIYNQATSVPTAISSLSNVTAAGGIWEIVNKSENVEALTFTDTVGTFEVAEKLVAVAKNTVTGEVIASVDGILTIPAGSYEVTVCEYFANTGDELYVYNASEINVGELEHTEKEGMLFIGWVDKATGEAVKNVDYYVYGDVLKAEYIPYDEADFSIEEAQVRTGDTSLRFIFNQNKVLTDKLPTIVEYGALTLPTNTANGVHFYADKAAVKSWTWDMETKTIFAPTGYGPQAVKVVANNVLEESEDYLKYTLCLKDIESSKRRTFYGARGYLVFADLNGNQHIIYTDEQQFSIYKAAAQTPAEEQTDAVKAVITYCEETLADIYWTSNPISGYVSGYAGCTDTNPNHKLFTQAGIRLGDATIETGMGTEETKMLFVTDPHFNYTNEVDIASGNSTLLANYRARTWLGGGASAGTVNNIMNYGSFLDKIVVGGDAVDFVADGCMSMVKSLLAQKSINGSVRMVLGNHETMEIGGNPLDVPYSNKWTAAEKMAMNQEYWTNNVYYDSEIIKKANGDNNAMLIYMDNHTGKFWDSQIPSLTEDLTYARNNNIPVLIFFHIPIATFNEAETEVYVNGTYGGGSYGTAEVNSAKRNYYNGMLGNSSSDAASQAIVSLIRKHSDVVKGVFDGHEHEWAYTEIIGIDENGNANGNVIPQYNVYGSHYGGATVITLK